MPISLPPLTRRQFIASSLAAGLFGRSALAAESDPHLFALFSDTHIAAERKLKFRNVSMAENLDVAVRELSALERRPAGLIVNGDMAFKFGLSGDYTLFTELLKPIRQAGLPVHLTLGNHDDRGTFLKSLGGKLPQEPVANRHVAVVPAPRARFVLLDSLDFVNKTPGVFGVDQIRWLTRTLDAAPDAPTIVFGHHDPGSLFDMDEFLKVIDARRQVKAYVFGHTHAWGIKQRAGGLHLINLPPTAYPFEPKAPSGWVKAAIEPDGMKLELRCIDPNHKAHGEKHDLKWRN